MWQTLFLAILVGGALSPIATRMMERVPDAEALRPRAHCRACAAPVALRDQFPVFAWLTLRGRCRACGQPIGTRQLLAELVSIAAAGVILAQPWSPLLTLTWLVYLPIGVALAFIDLRHKRLPNLLTLRSAAALVVLLGIASIPDGLDDWLRALAAGGALFIVYLLMNILTRGAMGMGDVKLALGIGLLAGYLSWFAAITTTMLAFLLGGAVSAVLLLSRRASRKDAIPFGPFMLLGLVAVLPFLGRLQDWLLA